MLRSAPQLHPHGSVRHPVADFPAKMTSLVEGSSVGGLPSTSYALLVLKLVQYDANVMLILSNKKLLHRLCSWQKLVSGKYL